MKPLRVALLCLPLLAACGDDGVTADEYAGTWLITSMTVTAPTGGAVTYTRDGDPMALRGDVVIAATGDTAATMHVRQMLLENEVPVAAAQSVDVTIALDGDRWVVTEPDAVTVFTAMVHEGEHLMLTLDPDDPRTTATDPPREVQAMRAEPWGTACVGGWDLVSMTIAGTTYTANECLPLGGDRWGKLQMMIAFDGWLTFSQTTLVATYRDAACTDLVSMNTTSAAGLAEEDAGAALRLWSRDADSGEHLELAITTAGDLMTLDRTACAPMPACIDGAPTRIIVHKR